MGPAGWYDPPEALAPLQDMEEASAFKSSTQLTITYYI